MSNFAFLTEWQDIKESAMQAEELVRVTPRAACFYCRYTLEQSVKWMYRYDEFLEQPAQHPDPPDQCSKESGSRPSS